MAARKSGIHIPPTADTRLLKNRYPFLSQYHDEGVEELGIKPLWVENLLINEGLQKFNMLGVMSDEELLEIKGFKQAALRHLHNSLATYQPPTPPTDDSQAPHRVRISRDELHDAISPPEGGRATIRLDAPKGAFLEFRVESAGYTSGVRRCTRADITILKRGEPYTPESDEEVINSVVPDGVVRVFAECPVLLGSPLTIVGGKIVLKTVL